jgi:hypothetical protein
MRKKVKNCHEKRGYAMATFFLVAVLSFFGIANAQVMSSSNYKIQIDSVNFGGGNSVSGSYKLEDTAGEAGTGLSSSANYAMKAGYQQANSVFISVTPASDVTMSPAINGLTGGTSTGQTSFTVTTDNPAGYTVLIRTTTSPALTSPIDSFGDYIPSSSDPDFTFFNNISTSSFGFSPEGTDVASRYLDNGVSCGTGSGETIDSCWDGLSTSDKEIFRRATANIPSGTSLTVKFKAVSGPSHIQKNGTYTAESVVTVLPL